MGSAPNGKHPCTDQGSEMHIGGIHANQQIQPADQGQFLIQGILARHAFTRDTQKPIDPRAPPRSHDHRTGRW